MVGVYKIVSPTDKMYIGQSWDIHKRINHYKNLWCKRQPKLYSSLNKYGFQNHDFEVIHELPNDITQEVLDTYEILYWDLYKTCGFDMLNLKEPGIGGKHDKDTINKIANTNRERGHYNNLQDRLNSKEAKIKRKQTRLEKGLLDNFIKVAQTQEAKEKRNNTRKLLGLDILSIEHMRGKSTTPRAIEKMRNALMKKVMNLETGEIYESRKAAAASNGVTSPTMGKWIKIGKKFKYIIK